LPYSFCFNTSENKAVNYPIQVTAKLYEPISKRSLYDRFDMNASCIEDIEQYCSDRNPNAVLQSYEWLDCIEVIYQLKSGDRISETIAVSEVGSWELLTLGAIARYAIAKIGDRLDRFFVKTSQE
jgi:hypothetical protein